MSIAITIGTDEATPMLRQLGAACEPRRIAAAIGPACAKQIKQHFLTLPANRRGPSTHFWARAARATSWQPQGDDVLITVNQIGVRQRYYGGAIKPVNKDALAIPISPVSYGHVPADFPGLFLLKTPKGAYLARKAGGKKAKGEKIELLFKLSKGVNQSANPDIIPAPEAIQATAFAAVVAAVNREIQRGGAG